MTFKLPYIGRSIKYYTVSVVSCVVLGRSVEGFGSAADGNFSQRSPRLISHFARTFPLLQFAAGQLHRRGSQDVWAHLCRKSRHSVDSNLGKILAENHVSFEFKFQTMLRAQVLTHSQSTQSFNRFCVTIPTRHSRFPSSNIKTNWGLERDGNSEEKKKLQLGLTFAIF